MPAPPAPVDLDRPLLPQVADLREGYDAWVHRSIRPATSLRIFRSDLLEWMSHIPWWLVLVVWIPIVTGLFVVSIALGGVPWGRALGLGAVGLFVWTFVEYVLHRFVFHFKPRSSVGRRLHFLGHGIHHLDPWDGTRLVFPPLLGVLIATPIYLAIWLAVSWTDAPTGIACAVMGGLLAGYIVYDLTHYYTHHAKPRSRVGKWLKAYHLAHHHKHWERMFGVSQPLWDIVFRTGRPTA